MKADKDGKNNQMKLFELPKQRTNVSVSKLPSKSKQRGFKPLEKSVEKEKEYRKVSQELPLISLNKIENDDEKTGRTAYSNEREDFMDLISFAKKGDKVSFMKHLEM